MLRTLFAALALVCAASATTPTVTGSLCSGTRAIVTLTRVNSTDGIISTSSQAYTNGSFAATLQSGEDGSRYLVDIVCPSTRSTQYWIIPAVAGPLTTTQVSVASTVRIGPYYWDTTNNLWASSAAGINSAGGGGGGGSSTLSGLTDVSALSPSDKDALFYDSASGKWTKRTMAGGADGCLDFSTSPWNPAFLFSCLYTQAFPWTGYHDLSGGKIRLPESALGSLPTASSNPGKRYYVPPTTPTFTLPCVSGDCISNSTTWVSLNPRSDTWSDSAVSAEDEFVSGTGANGTVGALGWSLTSNGTITSQTHTNGDRNHPGIFRFGVASATVTGEHVMWLGSTAAAAHLSGLQTTSGWELRWRVRIPSTNQSAVTEAGTQYWVGVGAMASNAIAATVPTEGFFAHFTSGANGPWSLETLKAGAADAAAQASTSGNIALGTWYTIRIRSIAGNDGAVLISVNAGSGFETEKSFAVTSTTSLTPMVVVQTTAATASLPRQLDVDSFRFAELVTRY
jgi:hypothetical protein